MLATSPSPLIVRSAAGRGPARGTAPRATPARLDRVDRPAGADDRPRRARGIRSGADRWIASQSPSSASAAEPATRPARPAGPSPVTRIRTDVLAEELVERAARRRPGRGRRSRPGRRPARPRSAGASSGRPSAPRSRSRADDRRARRPGRPDRAPTSARRGRRAPARRAAPTPRPSRCCMPFENVADAVVGPVGQPDDARARSISAGGPARARAARPAAQWRARTSRARSHGW